MQAMMRLTWRVQRVEIVILALACAALAGVALLLVTQLHAAAPPAGCFDSPGGATTGCPDPSSFSNLAQFSREIQAGIALLPLAIGAALGSQLVGQEIERGTAQLAWSHARSRRRWLAERSLISAALVAALLVLPSLLSHLLQGAIEPTADPAASLVSLGARGPALVMRGIAALAFGVLLGAALGRVLPALLLSLPIYLLLVFVTTPIATFGESHTLLGPLGTSAIGHSIVSDDRYLARDGVLLTYPEVISRAPDPADEPGTDGWVEENFQHVAIGIPGSRYPALEARLALFLGAVSTFAFIIAGAVVRRRRPH